MARTLYGGTDVAYFAPGGAASAPVYSDAGLTMPVTDLRAVVWTAGVPTVGAPVDEIDGDPYRYYSFFGPDGFTGPLYSPKAYTTTGYDPVTNLPIGVPNPSAGALRIDPNPSQAYASTKTVSGVVTS